MKKIEYKKIQETVYYEQLDNGLKVYLIPKAGYKKYFACFGTKYGSNTNTFIPYGEKDYISVPLGIAHFLEHKSFEMPDETDAGTVLATKGIDGNAYTSFVETMYIVSGTKEIDFAVPYLLDFVQTPYFTDENVQKEQGIIEQEIKMYLDSPREKLYYGLLENMYSDNSIKYDIGGTVSSIKKINKDLLQKCYDTFYHPSNMILCVIGNIDKDQLILDIKQNQAKKTFPKPVDICRKFLIEENVVNIKKRSIKMDIAIPKASIGVKLPFIKVKKNDLMMLEIKLKIILEALLGISSKTYQDLLDQELISGGYNFTVTVTEMASFIRVSSDTTSPDEFLASIHQKLLSISELNLSKEEFERYKKAVIGSFIKGLNSVDNTCTSFVEYLFRESNLFEIIDELNELSIKDLKPILKYFVEEAITEFIIYPINK